MNARRGEPARGHRVVRAWALGAALTLAALAAAPAGAQGLASCSVSAAGLEFGAYDYLSAPAWPGSTTLTVACTCASSTTLAYTLALSAGQGSGFASRSLLGASGRLGYGLYTNAARTVAWGDGTGGTSTVGASAASCPRDTGHSANYTIYGQIPSDPGASPGYYADPAVVITLSY